MLHEFSPVDTLLSLVELFMMLLSQGWIIKTILFVILAGSIMALLEKSGGIYGFVEYLLEKKQLVTSQRSALMLSYVLGLLIFVETSITALVSGAVGKPLCQRFQIPREKLAYVCDSTAAPLGSLIVFNGYGALLLGLIGMQISLGNLSGLPLEILFNALIHNFYAIFALLMTFFVIYFSIDIGPMKHARFLPLKSEQTAQRKSSPFFMILPLVLMILLVFLFLFITGEGNILKGSGSSAIFYTMAVTLAFTFFYFVFSKNMTPKSWFNTAYRGGVNFVGISFLLLFAFALGEVSVEMQTGNYLASLASQILSPHFLAAVIFLLSGVISFATGTSWGTFSIMIPIAVPMAFAMDASSALVIGAVISGGIFGDHCSPVSDTTIISSMASECSVVDHVKTQLPYALLSALAAFVFFVLFGLVA